MRATLKKATVATWLMALVATACSSTTTGGSDSAPAGILRIGVERPQSLDPAQARFPAEFLIADQLFDGLTAYDPATLAVRPALAARWDATPDQLQWDFFLRPGARFSNGRTITADDVKYSLERIARRGSASPAAVQLEAIAGFKAFNSDRGTADGLAGVSMPGPNVVRIQLEQPFSSLPAVLGSPPFGIVPREAVESPAPRFSEQPVGSGPFMIRSRNVEVIRLMPAPGVKMALRGVDVHMARDSAAPYSAFLRGRLDWTAIPADRLEQVTQTRGRDGFRPYPAELFYGFNLKNRKFADARFREAIVRAIDREAIVREVYGRRVRLAHGLIAEGVPGHQPQACGDKCRYDPGRARALLAETFEGEAPPEVQIDYDEDPIQQAVARRMQANLQAVGIPAALRPHPYTEYLTFASSGQQEMFRLAWIGAYPTPDAFLTPLFSSGHADNVTGFSSPEVDELLRQGRAEPDERKRIELYRQAEKLVLDQLPVVPIAQYETHTLVSPRVRDLLMSAFGTFDASRVTLND